MTNSGGDAGDPGAVLAPIAIVAGHGDFAAGLISAVAQISGRGERLLAVSNREFGAGELEEVLRAASEAHPIRVLFTDLPGGSCTMAARRLLRARPDLALVTGANLATVLDYVLGAEEAGSGTVAAGVEHAVEHAVEKGRLALAAVFPPTAPAAPATGAPATGAAARPPALEVGGAG